MSTQMTDRYNNLCQTGQVEQADFHFEQTPLSREWMCKISRPIKCIGVSMRKRDAKALVCKEIVQWFDAQKVRRPGPEWSVPRVEHTVYVLVDADSLNATLSNLAPWANEIEWLVVLGFANPATNLAPGPWHIYRSEAILPDSADHLLTWHAAQLTQTLSEPAYFVVVSRDAALQNTVHLLQKGGHKAYFVAHEIGHIKEIVDLLGI